MNSNPTPPTTTVVCDKCRSPINIVKGRRRYASEFKDSKLSPGDRWLRCACGALHILST